MHNNNSLYAEIKVQYRRENNNFIRLYNINIYYCYRFVFDFILYTETRLVERRKTHSCSTSVNTSSLFLFFFSFIRIIIDLFHMYNDRWSGNLSSNNGWYYFQINFKKTEKERQRNNSDKKTFNYKTSNTR